MAPVILELAAAPMRFACRVVVTAQHREMLDQVLSLFHIRPDLDLNIMEEGQSLTDITVRALRGLGEAYASLRPDLVLVHGDTTTTFAGALAAFYQQLPVGHVEAGLRTYRKDAPFPEEMNRHLTGVLADLHFAPTAAAAANLEREGVPPERIFVTGNTVIDALLRSVRPGFRFQDPALASLDFGRRVILVTTHRRENWGEPMRRIFRALREVLLAHPDVTVVFPVHKNPRIRQLVATELAQCPRLVLCEPLDYASFVNLMARAYLVLTDSGGLQEEAPSLGKPVLVLREATERPEALAAGTAVLVGTKKENIVRELGRLLTDEIAYQKMATAVNPYGDGLAAVRIRQALEFYFGLRKERPQPFPAPPREEKVAARKDSWHR
ncbi:MAG: UDP-N-acetylglucosamine 2-epimerase (non-hydrolyzing) [Clostridia bacterium]|nr:UDP-N-acetylglucosamine 2-epimerase (non-hydrolyzing) [Clostridia bacterium]